MAAAKKIEDAVAHIREAEKSLKTSLLKWKPDYDIAADEFNQAGLCYKMAKQYSLSRDCYLKATENYKINRSFFSAAKALDQAAHVSKDLNDYDAVFTLCERAAVLYQEHGVPDTAALCLEKGAKLLEAKCPDKALHMYRHAVDIVMAEDRPRQAAEFQSKVCRLSVKMQTWDRAVDSILREIGFHQQSENNDAIGRLTVALVLVQLARGDTVAADKAFRDWGSYSDQEEVRTLGSLLEAYDEDDGDQARKALNSPFIKHMDIEYAKLARDLQVPKGSSQKKPKDSGEMDDLAKGVGDASIKSDDEELNLC
ncbi:gamma Soluble NSF attachment protein 1 [Oratosquilla oratoria]|uniref:gamma Soluble NSF attachment protein 1 n=1 Tax=Oratosquilla oratoria TaxID=337810 RepID=UPI003F76D121